jgi:hypothetical protein
MEPEDLHGWLEYSSTPQHKTNILPLRWFANACNHLSSFAIERALDHEDFADYNGTELSRAGYRWWKIWAIINIPYDKWGTTYLVDWHR